MSNGKSQRWVSFSILIVAALVCGIPSLIYPFGKDQGMFAWAGNLILNGAVPYRDIWDVKPPGVLYTYALAETLFGYSMSAARCLDFIWQLLIVFLIYGICRRISRREAPAVIAGIIYIASYWIHGFWNTAQADGFINLPIAAAVLLFIGMLDKKRTVPLCLAIGALVGIAFYFKYPVALMIIAFIIILIRSRTDRPIHYSAMIVAGTAIVVAAFILYLYRTQALGEFFYIQFTFLPQYRKVLSTIAPGSRGLIAFLRLKDLFCNFFVYPPLLVLAAAAYLVSLRRRVSSARIHLIAVWGIVALATLYLQGKFYIYHFLPLLPPLSIGASFAICYLFDKNQRKELRGIALLAILGVCVLSWIYSNPRYRRYCMDVWWDSWKAIPATVTSGGQLESYYMNVRFTADDFSFPADVAVASYIAYRTEPNDRIYIWGMEPIVYWLAGRRGPSPFIHNFALRTEWTPRRYGRELMEDLKREPPRYFLVVRNDPLPWMIGTRVDSKTDLMKYPALVQWLNNNYQLESVIDDFELYARKDD